MNTELLVNVIILCCVGLFCVIAVFLFITQIAVRCYLSCRRSASNYGDNIQTVETVCPEIQVKQEDLDWTKGANGLARDQCCICLEENVNTVTGCGHKFHMNCLVEWKKRMKNICPYCKGQDLSLITFYCHYCIKSCFSYHFQSPVQAQRNHMVPKFFIDFLSSQRKLLCPSCKQSVPVSTNSTPQKQSEGIEQVEERRTRNLDSIRLSSQEHESNRSSRNRDPVDIEIKNFSPVSMKTRTSNTEQDTIKNQLTGPLTRDRLLMEIDY